MRSTASLPGFLRAIRTNHDDRWNSSQDSSDGLRRERPVPRALVTDPSFHNGPSFASFLSAEPSPTSATSPGSPSSPYFPRRRSAQSSLPPPFEMDESDSQSAPISTRRASKARVAGASNGSSDDSYNGDGEGTSSERATRARPHTSGGSGSGSPLSSSSSKWVKALKLGLGGKKAPKRPSSLASDGSSAWEFVNHDDEDAPARRSFEVLHRRPTSTRSQSATAVETASRGRTLGEGLRAESLPGGAAMSTSSLGKIDEAPSIRERQPSDSASLTPVPSLNAVPSPLSTPRASRTALDFSRVAQANAPPAASLLSTGRPSIAPASSTPLRPREHFLAERYSHDSTSSDDEDPSQASGSPPTTHTSFSYSSAAPPTPDLVPSRKAAYRTSRSGSSPTALKRSTGQHTQLFGPSDSDVSLASTVSSNSEDGGNETPASSAAELDEERGDLSPDEEAALVARLARGMKPSQAAIWQVKGKLRREMSDQSEVTGADDVMVPDDLERGIKVW